MNYFKGSQLAQMSDGTYCIIRDLGLVKGGKGLRHFERLLTLSPKGVALKLVQVIRHIPRLFQNGAIPSSVFTKGSAT
jgi:hypothetical protein